MPFLALRDATSMKGRHKAMFNTFTKKRHGIASPAHRFSHRLRLERLEDRLIPSIGEGTILVATSPDQGFSTIDQSSFPTGIIGVDPITGAQTQVSTGNLFALP